MKKIKFLLMALVMALPAFAADHVMEATKHVERQAAEPVLTLSLLEAKDYAIRQNRSLRNAGMEVQAAYAQRWQTIASMLPSSDLSGSYSNYCNYEMELNFGGMPVKMNMPNYASLGIQTAMGLNAQGVIGAVMQTQAIAMKKIQYEQSELELACNVWQCYSNVLALESITQLLDSSLANIMKLETMTQHSVDMGVVEQTTADQIHVRVNTLKNNITAQRRAIDLSKAMLKIYLDVPASTEIVLTQTLDELLNSEVVLNLLSQGFDINNNLNYQLLQKNVEVAKLGVHSAAWAYGPTITAAHVFNKQHYFADGGMRMTPPNLVQIGVSMPLWSSGKRAAGVVEKKIALEEARNTLATATDQLYIQNQQLRNQLQNDYETYCNEKENMEVTKRVFASTGNKFYYGAASNMELTNASNDLISAQSTFIQSVIALVNAQIELVKFLNNK